MYLHPKHGLNPTMTTCFICGKAKDILLIGLNTNQFERAGLASSDGKMNHQIGCIDKEPCNECKSHMEQGIILISVKDGDESDNPYRTGGWVVIKEEAIKRMLEGSKVLDSVLKMRMCFIPDSVWKMIGLPTESVK